MGVQIVNQRYLTASAGQAAMTVAELRQLIAGLADTQRVDLAVTHGYSDPRESSPDSIKLTIDNPQPAGPVYRDGGAFQADRPVAPR